MVPWPGPGGTVAQARRNRPKVAGTKVRGSVTTRRPRPKGRLHNAASSPALHYCTVPPPPHYTILIAPGENRKARHGEILSHRGCCYSCLGAVLTCYQGATESMLHYYQGKKYFTILPTDPALITWACSVLALCFTR